jgi:hypothetical protein
MSTITTQRREKPQGGISFPIQNVALLGQFNYDVPMDQTQSWVTIWSKYFTTVSVVGPFSNVTYRTLRRKGVKIYLGANDKGYFSPVKNVVDALKRVPAGIEALLYVHDDGLLNLTMFARGRSKIPTNRFMGNLYHSPEYSYSITVPSSDNGEIIYDIPGHKNTPTTNRNKFLQALPPWFFNKDCVDQHVNMVTRRNSKVKDFATRTIHDGSFYSFATHGQQDFLFVPMSYKDQFIRIARLFIDNSVFLECAFPTIILWLLQEEQRRNNATKKEFFASSILLKEEARKIPICTSWDKEGSNARGSLNMLQNCFKSGNAAGMYHPIKLSVHNASTYAYLLDQIQRPLPLK